MTEVAAAMGIITMEGRIPNWYLLHLKPKCEDLVTHKLQGCGFEVYNPKLRERKYSRRKLQEVISPLFPCYVFAKFELLSGYRLIRYTRGVRRVVGTDDLPTPVSGMIIDSLRARAEDGAIKIERSFIPGEPVLIKGGPFQGIDAIFEKEMNGVERVSVLLKEINARVLIDSCLIEKVK